LWIYDLDNNTQTQLTSGNGSDGEADWHPDGNKIVFHSDRNGQLDIWEIELTTMSVNKIFNKAVNPAYSPDGKKLAYAAERNGQWDILGNSYYITSTTLLD